MKGTVKSYGVKRGFGFIQAEDGKEIYFHYSSIQKEGFRIPVVGDILEFNIQKTSKGKGLQAINIKLVKEELVKA